MNEHSNIAMEENAQLDQAKLHLSTLFGQVETLCDLWVVMNWSVDNRFLSKAFRLDQLDAAARFGINQCEAGHDVYLRVCPMSEPPVRGKRGSAADSAALCALYADLDVGKRGHPKTVEEALGIMRDAVPLEPTTIVSSGHGLHVYFVFVEPIVDMTQATCLAERWKETIKAKFEQQNRSVDSVFDLARVLRLAGTINYKDEPMPVRLIEHEPSRLYAVDDVERFLIDVPFSPPANSQSNPKSQSLMMPVAKQHSSPPLDLGAMEHLLREEPKLNRLWEGDIAEYQDDNSRADLAFCSLLAHRLRGVVMENEESPVIDALMRRSKLMRPKWDEQRGSSTYGADTIAKALNGTKRKNRTIYLTDVGNAERFALQRQDRMRFLYGPNTWLVWNGKRWKPDENGSVVRLAKKTVLSIYDEAKLTGDEGQQKEIAKHAIQSQRRERITAMIDLAKPELAISSCDVDVDPFLFNVENGTVDLHTGELRSHLTTDYITKIAPVVFDPDARAPRFQKVLNRIFAGDDDLIGYVQRMLGMALTGDIREQFLWIFVGVGANGKNTLLDTVCGLMGDYAGLAPPHLLTASHHREHPTELADLMGKRLVVASETEEDARLRLQLVKQLTGNPKIKARFMRQDFFEFARTHKLILMTNNLPRIEEETEATWRRIRVIPFNVVIPEVERDNCLMTTLQAEWPGILSWLVRGCVAWLESGLCESKTVTLATNEYRYTRDSTSRFINECCDLTENTWTASKVLCLACEEWSRATGQPNVTLMALVKRLKSIGLRDGKQKGERGWHGIRLT